MKLHLLHNTPIHILVLILATSLLACTAPSTPKPYGYYRLYLPPHDHALCTVHHTEFALNKMAQITHKDADHPDYFNIDYPTLNATIHCSYLPVQKNLALLLADAQDMVYSHAVKASAIPEQEYIDPDNHTYGVLYELQGNTATPVQFFLTDSTQHFFRAAVYINTIPNQDSLAPVIDYLTADVRLMMESFRWRL